MCPEDLSRAFARPEERRDSTREAAELPAREGYAAWAACYDDDGNPLIALEGPALQALYGPVAGQPVLDLGCGTGRHALTLAQAGARVTAVDQCPEMLSRARALLHGHSVQWLLHALPDPLPVPAEAFALVVLGLVAEHVADLTGLLREAARRCIRAGVACFRRCTPIGLAPVCAPGSSTRGRGSRQPITTYHRTASEYHAAAASAGLVRVTEQTLVAPTRAGRVVPAGRPLCWAAPGVGGVLGKAAAPDVAVAVLNPLWDDRWVWFDDPSQGVCHGLPDSFPRA